MRHVIQHVHHLLNTMAAFVVLPNKMDKALTHVRQLVQMAVNAVTHMKSFWSLVTYVKTRELVAEGPL